MPLLKLSQEKNPKLRIDVNNSLIYKDKKSDELKERKIETALTDVVKEAGKVAGLERGKVNIALKVNDAYENYYVNKDKDNNIILVDANNTKDNSKAIYFNAIIKEDGKSYYNKMNTDSANSKRIIENLDVKIVTKGNIESKYIQAHATFKHEKILEALTKAGTGHHAVLSKTGAKIVKDFDNTKKKELKQNEKMKNQDISRER